MGNMFRLILSLGLLALASVASAAPNGHKLYTQHCSVCHNENGMGGIGLPLNGEKVEHFPRDYLFKTIRVGREGRVMPAFSKLSDAQINAIVDFILSWKKTDEIDTYSEQPVTGNINNGKKLFLEKCSACHGKDGKSNGQGTGVTLSRERKFQVVPPALNNPGFLAAANDEWIRQTIKIGRPGTIMPSQAVFGISDSELNDIVSYVRSFATSYSKHEALNEDKPTLVFDSPYDFATTVDNLKQTLKGMNFRYFPDRYMEMGLAPDNMINKKQLSLRFCNFNQLYKMLNIEPRVGVVLPCRVTIVEQPDGQVKLYVINIKVVTRLFNNTQLSETAAIMHESLMELIDEATL
jgi:cytochrome c oxidase cbb3-type subunit 3